jgi:hypothetical protein
MWVFCYKCAPQISKSNNNVPVVYTAREVIILMRPNPLHRPLKGVFPKNRDFLGSEMAMALKMNLPSSKSKRHVKKNRYTDGFMYMSSFQGPKVSIFRAQKVSIFRAQKVSIFRAHPFQWP